MEGQLCHRGNARWRDGGATAASQPSPEPRQLVTDQDTGTSVLSPGDGWAHPGGAFPPPGAGFPSGAGGAPPRAAFRPHLAREWETAFGRKVLMALGKRAGMASSGWTTRTLPHGAPGSL